MLKKTIRIGVLSCARRCCTGKNARNYAKADLNPVAVAVVARLAASQPKLPDGVTVEESGSEKVYSFSVADSEVTFVVASNAVNKGFARIGFDIDGETDKVGLTVSQGAAVFKKIARLMRYDAITRPDGFKYDTSAWTGDKVGATRAEAYIKAGFSRPIGGKVGSDQFAVVKNGKLVPDMNEVKKRERQQGLTASAILKNMRDMKRQREQERKTVSA